MRASTSTHFDVSVAGDSELDDWDDNGTVIHTSTAASSDLYEEIGNDDELLIHSFTERPVTAVEMDEVYRLPKRLLTQAVAVYNDEFRDVEPADSPMSEIKEQVAQAKLMKNQILQALLDCSEAPEQQVGLQLKDDATAARIGFIEFIKSSNRLIRDDELRIIATPHPAPSIAGSLAQISLNRAKRTRVANYTDTTIGDLRGLIDRLHQLSLEEPESQLEFRSLQDRTKTAQKELDIVKREAKELISHAIDCDLADECSRIESAYRELERKEVSLHKNIQELKDEYGLAGDSNKFNDLKYPTFSGDQTDKNDYYSFAEDWESYVAIKAPSRSEQLRLLTRQALTGTAKSACKHMTSLEAVFAHLRDNFGNVSDLFSSRVEDIRRLGPCQGGNEKKRKWSVEVRSQLTYLRDLSIKHSMFEDLYTHPVIAEIQENLPVEILRKFLKEIRKVPGQVSKKVVFEMLLEYLDEVNAIFNHQHSYKLDHGVDPDKSIRAKFESKKIPVPAPTKSSSKPSKEK